jgi:hypothetical protein
MSEQSTKTIVVNDTSRILQFPMPRKVADGMVEHDILRLLPGANVVDAKVYESQKKNFGSDVFALDKPLSSLSERDAISIVSRTINLELLKAFEAADKRDRVRKAIAAQIAECSGKAKSEEVA